MSSEEWIEDALKEESQLTKLDKQQIESGIIILNDRHPLTQTPLHMVLPYIDFIKRICSGCFRCCCRRERLPSKVVNLAPSSSFG